MPDPTPPSAPAPWIPDTAKKWIGRAVLTLAISGVGYLQTGQWKIEEGADTRDTDTVALLKALHGLELRLQHLEDRLSLDTTTPWTEPVAAEPDVATPAIEMPLDKPADLAKALDVMRSKVSKEEIDVYQRSR